MTNRMTDAALHDIGTAGLDWTAGTIAVLAVTDAYVFDVAHDNLNDVAAPTRIGSTSIPGRTVVTGVWDGTNVLVASAAGLVLGGLWIYKNTGVESTSRLIFWIDENADGTPISGTTTADGIVVPWSDDGIARFASLPT